MATGKFVANFRVSTKRQGRSGLGIDAQKRAVSDFLNGGRWKLVAEFVELESGRARERPELQRALAACRAHRATLVVAKLDRLARNPRVLYDLRDSGVEFVAVDMPSMNRMVAGIMAHVAEEEAEAISQRTRAALAAAKRRGVRLGNPQNLTRAARARGQVVARAVQSAKADGRARDLAGIVSEIRFTRPSASLREVAAELNLRGIEAPRGGAWSPVQVSRLLKRMAALSE